MALHHYLPQDRLRAVARGASLPDRTQGTALLADIAGFTTLTEQLAHTLGQRRGIEALMQRVNGVYDALIGAVERCGGSVIGFAGDAVTCWFDAAGAEGLSATARQGAAADGLEAAARRGAAAAVAMQAAMGGFGELSVKVGVCTGSARRFAIGSAEVQRIDVVAGATMARAAQAEGLARAGEVVVDEATAALLDAPRLEACGAARGERFFVLHDAGGWLPPPPPAEPLIVPAPALLQPWVLPLVVARESAGEPLFATDLRPTTALFIRFAGLDYDHDHDAGETLHALVSQVQLEVQRHGGVMLELTIGDKGSYLYGSFGAAQVHEDDAARALRAAVALREHFAGSPLAVQFGLSSGTMRVGGYGGRTRKSFGALGDDVNAAARLMGLARPGEILVTGRVRNAAADEFVTEARPPIPMKGKTEPVPVFAVVGLRQQRAISLQEPAYALPMVGRDAEAALVAQALERAARGQGRVLGITAEAGMGKSRLVAEGVRLARRAGWVGYGGACQLDGSRAPYRVWQPIWSAFFNLDPRLPLRRQMRAIESELQETVPDHAEAGPLLGAVLGLDLPDNAFTQALQPKDRKALLETVLLQCLRAAAAEAAESGSGVLLVLDDLHAIDPLSLDLLLVLARAAESLPVLMLLAYRDAEVDDTRADLAPLRALGHFDEVALDGLGAPASEQLVRAKLAALFPERVGAVPPALIERVGAQAQGNPFYLEELLNYLHDRGIDPRRPDALQALEMPASLHSLVLSRMDQLAARHQRVLKVASVIGRVFRVAHLHGYYPALGDLASLAADLRELDRLGFTPEDRSAPEPAYVFKHLVTLEVAYQSLAQDTRVQLHGLYARHLETRAPERLAPLAAQLAHHYARAEMADKASHWLRRAGEQAAARFANDEALALFAQALQWLPADDHAARFDVGLRIEAVLDLQGRHAERREQLAALEALASLAPPPADTHDVVVQRATLAARRAKLDIDTGDYTTARRVAAEAIAAIEALAAAAAPDAPAIDPHDAAPSPIAALHVDLLLLHARALFFAGEPAAAASLLDRAYDRARSAGYTRGEYQSHSQRGLLHWQQGEHDAASRRLGQAAALIRAAGHVRPEIDILNNLGVVAKARGRFDEALAHYAQAQPVARRAGDRSAEAMLLINMASASLVAGRFHAALQHAEAALQMLAALDDPTQLALALTNRAEALRELGQPGAAEPLLQRALTLLRSSGFKRAEASVLENLGLVAQARGDADAAIAHLQQARELAHAVGARALEASALQHLARVLLEADRFDAAEAMLEAAQALQRELDDTALALEVQTALALLDLRRADAEAPARALARLRPLLPLLADDDAATAASRPWRPLHLHRAAWSVLHAAGDSAAAALLAQARALLARSSAQIPDAALRQSFLQRPEHRALMAPIGPAPQHDPPR